MIGSQGYFSWIKPLLKVTDEELLDQVGCDALMYIRFIRLLRKLLFWMTVIGVGALIPVYIVATKYTGQVSQTKLYVLVINRFMCVVTGHQQVEVLKFYH